MSGLERAHRMQIHIGVSVADDAIERMRTHTARLMLEVEAIQQALLEMSDGARTLAESELDSFTLMLAHITPQIADALPSHRLKIQKSVDSVRFFIQTLRKIYELPKTIRQ